MSGKAVKTERSVEMESSLCRWLLMPALFLLLPSYALAQDLESRSFSPAPVGLNFLAVATGYANGSLLFDAASTLEDVTGEMTSVTVVYVRTLDFFGASAKAAVVLPMVWGDWERLYQGEWVQASRPLFRWDSILQTN